MKFDGIKTDRTFIKQVEIDNDKVKVELLGILHSVDSMELDGVNETIKFRYIDTYNEIELEFKRSSNAIVKVLKVKNKIATIKIIIFAMPLTRIYEKLRIKLNEKLLNKQLKENDFLITINAQNYIAIASGNNAKDTLFLNESQKIQNDINKLQRTIEKDIENKVELEQKIQDLEHQKQNIQVDEIAFTLLSDTKQLAIERSNMADDSIIYKATKLIEKTQKEIAGLRLIRLKEPFEFKDGSIRANIKDALEDGDLVSTYLDIWDKYAIKEGDFLLKKARDIGEIEIKEVDRFKLKVGIDLRGKMSENDFICIMENTPPYLENKEIDFKTYMQENITQEKLKGKNESNKIQTYKIERITSESIELEKQDNMNLEDLKGKKFSLSIFGDFVALKRKYKARQRMLEGKSANPILPMIFASEVSENLKKILNEQQKNTYPPLSDTVEQKIFKTKPTENQIEAIRMAINTKDIAIIQGPPGTGKTTVLNAIIERLNELIDMDLNKRGSIFIGGFQHTAVENLIQRMNLNGIPTPKYGKKTNEIDSLENYDYIMEWSRKIANNIVVKEDSQSIKDFKELAANYCKRPSQSKQKEILQKIIDTKELKLKECRDIARYLLDINNTNKIENNLSLIYAIRSNELSFQDDGIDRNYDLLESEFRELLTDKEKQILKNKIFCQDLIKLKNDLIRRFTPKPKFEKEKPNSEVLDLIEKVINVFNNLSIESRINVVLAEFKQKLQSNPFALKNMLKDYSIVFSATIGQSSGKEVLDAKGVQENNEEYSYDTVIIDEAAMVNPLDLFLVLVLAKHRIILVGDHRQLPHMLHEQVLKEMEDGTKEGDSIESELLKESMFGFLKVRAQELEKIDGVKRFITLNNQFRTHPLLGHLVSNIFYKEHNEGYESPRPESDFSHKLKDIEDIPAVWINLSKDMGIDSKNGTSRMRKCEIDMIESKLVEYMSSEAGSGLSYGIISFYRAQTDAIKDRIEKLKQNLNSIMIKEALEKVKIGSVDQFQGNEFDIVFLSTVRSGNINNNLSPQKAFGFLAVPNRLCVAMSRQKKCLIAVGDMAYFKSNLAKQYVRGMYEFASLCETKGRVL